MMKIKTDDGFGCEDQKQGLPPVKDAAAFRSNRRLTISTKFSNVAPTI
jgi:hypothetical protein